MGRFGVIVGVGVFRGAGLDKVGLRFSPADWAGAGLEKE